MCAGRRGGPDTLTASNILANTTNKWFQYQRGPSKLSYMDHSSRQNAILVWQRQIPFLAEFFCLNLRDINEPYEPQILLAVVLAHDRNTIYAAPAVSAITAN